MEKIKYILEIYEPDSVKDLWVDFEASEPFLSINKGDILNPGIWPDSQSPMKVLKVVNVEHLIFESKTDNCIVHKLMVFTKEVEGTKELRKTS